MARPKAEDNREIREDVAEGEGLSREQLAGFLLSWLTGGDIRGYAAKIRERMKEEQRDGAGVRGM